MRRKKKTITLIIKPDKVALGHQKHITGTGVHDSRPKRSRTRSQQRLNWRKENDC